MEPGTHERGRGVIGNITLRAMRAREGLGLGMQLEASKNRVSCAGIDRNLVTSGEAAVPGRGAPRSWPAIGFFGQTGAVCAVSQSTRFML